jgi:perosamine synthetase
MKIPITKPVFDDADRAAVASPLDTGWVVQGPNVARFEADFASYVGAPSAIACSNCTTGLHMGLAAAGVGPGDEVLVPAFTWVASANAVLYCGATPVLCDVSLDTFNVDLDDLEARLTTRTRAVVPVHLFGLPADMVRLMPWARRRGLAVIEDAACGLDARIDGQHVGTFGDFGAFSFHPRKAITTGEGGMVLCADAAKDALVRSLRDHGASKSDATRHAAKNAFLLSEFNVLGYNYRMTDMQGALGVTQLAKARWIHDRRSALAARYDQLLSGLSWLRTPVVPAGWTHGYQSYVCLFAPETPSFAALERLRAERDALMTRLEEDGIQTRQGTHAVHTLGYYRDRFDLRAEDYPNAALAENLSITLPLYPQMTEVEQDYVVEHLSRWSPG